MEVGKVVRIVEELESNHVSPDRQKAWEEYNRALVLMQENPGKYVEIQRATLSSPEHRAMWKVLMDFHPIYDWEARYPEIGMGVLYGRVPNKLTRKVKKWLQK